MTLLPSSDFGIRGHPGRAYAVNLACAVPGCGQAAIHAHHMWPRSYLRGQPYEWVELPDGTVVGNRIGLCVRHHDDATAPVGGHRAKIVFSSGTFWWEERKRGRVPGDGADYDFWHRVGALDPQPPGATQLEAKPKRASGACPTCGHRTHARTNGAKPGRKRTTKDWTLTVPDDAEQGAEILDEWSDSLATRMGFGDETSRLRRYHAVVTALAWTVQNQDEFINDLIGEG